MPFAQLGVPDRGQLFAVPVRAKVRTALEDKPVAIAQVERHNFRMAPRRGDAGPVGEILQVRREALEEFLVVRAKERAHEQRKAERRAGFQQPQQLCRVALREAERCDPQMPTTRNTVHGRDDNLAQVERTTK